MRAAARETFLHSRGAASGHAGSSRPRCTMSSGWVDGRNQGLRCDLFSGEQLAISLAHGARGNQIKERCSNLCRRCSGSVWGIYGCCAAATARKRYSDIARKTPPIEATIKKGCNACAAVEHGLRERDEMHRRRDLHWPRANAACSRAVYCCRTAWQGADRPGELGAHDRALSCAGPVPERTPGTKILPRI